MVKTLHINKSKKPKAPRLKLKLKPGPPAKTKRKKKMTSSSPEKTAEKKPEAAPPKAAPTLAPPIIMPQALAVNPITGTPTARTIILPVETRNNLSLNRKLILTWQDLKYLTSAAAQAIIPENALGASSRTLLPNTRVGRWILNVTAPFTSSGGAITTFTISVGDGVTPARFISGIDLKTAAWTLGVTADYLYTVADTIDITATIAGQTMASLNGGSLELYYDEVDLNSMPTLLQP